MGFPTSCFVLIALLSTAKFLIYRLHDAFHTVQKSVHFAGDTARPLQSGRSSKKADVFSLVSNCCLQLFSPPSCSPSPQGRLVLELFEGKQDDLELSQLSSSIPSPLRDFLTRCLCRSDPDRWTTEQLLAHAFIRDPLPQLLLAPSNSRRGVVSGSVATEPEEEEEEDEVEEGEDTVPRTADASGESKLKRDFEAFEQLGKGGFGSVIKVGRS